MTDDTTQSGYDAGYKTLFTHPPMIEDLMVGFVEEDWVEQIDFSTLEEVPGSYVSEDLKNREDDIIWRVKWQDTETWVFIYLLIEFQATVDNSMALRIMAYLSLLYQDLLKQKLVTPTKLPPIFPIVLYNGDEKWTAATNVKELIPVCPEKLRQYLPSTTYFLLSEQHYAPEKLDLQTKNLVKALFRLEQSHNPRDLLTIIKQLSNWLIGNEHQSLRRAFTTFLKRIILPRRFKRDPTILNEITDLQELNTVLATKIDTWIEEAEEKALKQGREQGREEGIQQGEAKTLQKQLTLKFGTLSEETVNRIQQLSSAELEACLERVLTAQTLEQIWGYHP